MSILQVKQALSRMTPRERKEIQLYLLRLKRHTPAWKRSTAKTIREMKGGRYTTLEQLQRRFARRKVRPDRRNRGGVVSRRPAAVR